MIWDFEWGLARLLGQWRLQREIPGQGSMTGLAVFEAAGDSKLLYRESGELRLETGALLRGAQSYFYEAIPTGFEVRFQDTGELFEQVTLIAVEGDSWVGHAQHLCAADTYISEYRFHANGTWQVQHTVTGPRKDYIIRTTYTRL